MSVMKGQYYLIPNIHFQGSFRECLLNSLDIFTFVVNPMLPPALTANNAFAQKRLQKKGIYCLHTKHINLCGGIDVVAFDKVKRCSLKVIPLFISISILSVLFTCSTSLGWSEIWISQPPWVSEQVGVCQRLVTNSPLDAFKENKLVCRDHAD